MFNDKLITDNWVLCYLYSTDQPQILIPDIVVESAGWAVRSQRTSAGQWTMVTVTLQ